MPLLMANLWFVFGILLSLPSSFFCRTDSCDFEILLGDDVKFCTKSFRVIYPNMGDVSCIYIPNCFEYQKSITKVWGPPWIKFPKADPERMYTLIMVDPDAPNRFKPKYRFWRHWLVVNIPGHVLVSGKEVIGQVLSPYHRPNPPEESGYHRYQFLLYKQFPGISPSLRPDEERPESWDVNAFAYHWILGKPVATTQFMAQHPERVP